jgi:hypothetical protein
MDTLPLPRSSLHSVPNPGGAFFQFSTTEQLARVRQLRAARFEVEFIAWLTGWPVRRVRRACIGLVPK